MRPRSSLIAIIAAISLVLSFTTAAGSPRPHHGWMPAGAGTLRTASASTRMLERAGMHYYGTIHATLAKAPKSLRHRNSSTIIENVLENVLGGEIVIIFQHVAKHPEIFREFKEWVLKKIGSNYTIYRNAGDGECIGDWRQGTINHEASCSSHHGIYWETYGTGIWWNTYTGGALTSRSTSNGSPIFSYYPKVDWHTWGFYEIKSSACGSHSFCGDTMVLKNHSSTGVSDTRS